MNKNTILSVLMVFLMVSSGVVGAVGTVSAQTTDSGGESATEKCVDNVDRDWKMLVPGVSVYQCISGAFSPAEYDSSTELENEAWNQAVSIQDYAEQRNTEYQNWNDRSLSSALLEAEKPLIEAHYAEKSEADARSAASEEIRQYYSAQLSNAYNANNQVYERAVSISKSTNADSNIDTPVIQFKASYKGATAGTFDEKASATQDTTLDYTTKTLPNGDDFDVVTTIKDVSIDGSAPTDIESAYALKYVDSDDDGQKDQYNIQVKPDDKAESGIIANDPYSDETRKITWQADHTTRINEIKNERNEAQGEVEQMATDLYSTHKRGTINPEEYVSGATLLEEYSQNDSHYSYSAAKAAVTGLNTDLDAQQIVQINGDTSTEYEGMILTGSEGPQLADHEVSTNSVFENESNVLQWDSGTEGEDTLTVTGGSTTYVSPSSSSNTVTTVPEILPDLTNVKPEFEIPNPDSESYKTITVTFGDKITVNDSPDDIGGQFVSGTASKIDSQTMEIVMGSAHDGSLPITADVSLNSTGETTFDISVENGSGTEVYSESGTMTIAGEVTESGTIDAVRQADSDGVSISDDGSSATIQESAVDDYALVDVSDGNTYVAYGSQTAADAGIPTGFEVGTQYTASDFGSVMLTYQNGDQVETLREDTIDTFTIVSASSAETGEEISVLDYSDGGQRTFTDTSNIREELDDQSEIQDVISQRGDVDPAGAGGSVEQRIQDGLLGFGAGVTVVVFIGGILVVLWLVGRITSFA